MSSHLFLIMNLVFETTEIEHVNTKQTFLCLVLPYFLFFFFLRKRELLKQVRDSFQLQKNKRADLNIQVLKGVQKVKLH